jgi:hypothetical protein
VTNDVVRTFLNFASSTNILLIYMIPQNVVKVVSVMIIGKDLFIRNICTRYHKLTNSGK